MIIQSDEDSLSRMLGVEPAQIPEAVMVEYELRLKMAHCDGRSGALGTIALIDLARSMKLAPPPSNKKPGVIDWSRVPVDGSVRVLVRRDGKNGTSTWGPGVYVGQVGTGGLAVRFDGSEYVHEVHRRFVRIARDEPLRPDEVVEAPGDIASMEPWVSLTPDDMVMVEDGDGYKEGKFCGVQGHEVLVLFEGDMTPRLFDSKLVTCLESRLRVPA